MSSGYFETTVLGGLPVEISFSYSKTSFAMNDPWVNEVDEWEISAVAGRSLKNYDWVYNRLTSDDEDKILEECYEHIDC